MKDALSRKPGGFWTRDETVKTLMTEYVKGEIEFSEVLEGLEEYCAQLGVRQTTEVISADIHWYARQVRKGLGLPSLREQKRAMLAAKELEQE